MFCSKVGKIDPCGITDCVSVECSYRFRCNDTLLDERHCSTESEYYELCANYMGLVGNYKNEHCLRCIVGDDKPKNLTKNTCDQVVPWIRFSRGYSLIIKFGESFKAIISGTLSEKIA